MDLIYTSLTNIESEAPSVFKFRSINDKFGEKDEFNMASVDNFIRS